MNRRLAGGIAAGAFALGALVGSAGSIVARDGTTACADLDTTMTEHMSGQGMGAMMSDHGMGSMMGPNASAMPMQPGDHDAHHSAPSAEPSK